MNMLVCLTAIEPGAWGQTVASNANRIRPYEKNPSYWQYKGRPDLLIGGSKTDHIFLLDDLRSHLDEIVAVGGNYVRCTMSQREGPQLKPHLRLSDGKFDLTRWNPDYWSRFEKCLTWCEQRNIIVQIELWDRFDYSREQWQESAWRPANNLNYTTATSGLAENYPAPSWRDRQPFFHTVPGSPRYDKRLDGVRKLQEEFVAKALSYSLQHGNVLYCIGNESSAPPAWSDYWAKFIARTAREKGVSAYVTQMYDKAILQPVVKRPDLYTFIDASKLLGPRRQKWAPRGEEQWRRALELRKSLGSARRPINAVKIITNQDADIAKYSIEKAWRGLFAGFAAIRFHRQPAGIALTEPAKACIRAMRKLESQTKLWDLAPRLDLLSDRDVDEAYLRAKPGEKYALYFRDGGSVGLNLTNAPSTFDLKWIDISSGDWAGEETISGGKVVTVQTPKNGGWAAAIVKRDARKTRR